MCLLLGMAQPGRLARLLAAPDALGRGPATCLSPWPQQKTRMTPAELETGNSKLETGNSKLERAGLAIGNRQSKIGNLYSGQGQGRWAEEKNFTNEATKLLKTKDRRTN